MKKKNLLLGIMVLSSGAYADYEDSNLNSSFHLKTLYSSEAKVRMYQGPGRSEKNYYNENGYSVNVVELTLGKGYVDMDGMGFSYDVTKYFNFDKNWKKQNESWDTEFGLYTWLAEFNAFGYDFEFTPNFLFSYDSKQNVTSKAYNTKEKMGDTKLLVQFIPTISTIVSNVNIEVNPIIAYDNITKTTAFELGVENYSILNKSFTIYGGIYFDIAGTEKNGSYSNAIFDGKLGEGKANINSNNKTSLSVEQYITYEHRMIKNLYFVNDFGVEGYSLLQSNSIDISLLTAPKLEYRAKVKELNIIPYIKYTAYTANKKDFDRDELGLGIKFNISF